MGKIGCDICYSRMCPSMPVQQKPDGWEIGASRYMGLAAERPWICELSSCQERDAMDVISKHGAQCRSGPVDLATPAN